MLRLSLSRIAKREEKYDKKCTLFLLLLLFERGGRRSPIQFSGLLFFRGTENTGGGSRKPSFSALGLFLLRISPIMLYYKKPDHVSIPLGNFCVNPLTSTHGFLSVHSRRSLPSYAANYKLALAAAARRRGGGRFGRPRK